MYAQTSLGQAQAGGDCSGWERDPQSFGKVVAEHYVRTVLGQALSATRGPSRVTEWTWRIDFQPDIAVYVSFQKVPTLVAAAQWYPKPAKPTRYYTYHCTQGQLVLSERKQP